MRKVSKSIIVFLFFISVEATAQSITTGFFSDALRSAQLLGQIDSSFSFTVLPISKAQIFSKKSYNFQAIDSTLINDDSKPYYFLNNKGKMLFLPLSVIQQFNSHHPYGWNDGAMISSKGYQTMISAGINASYGPLEIQLQPEFVFAANPSYESNSNYGNPVSKSFLKVFPGQSSIRLSAGVVSAGFSTENMWWGPGRHSSLLMSNNAPGFAHFFFQTRKPLRTLIGNFEWQLIGGDLTSNDQLPYENKNLLPNQLKSKSRYYSGMVISYHPKWVPGLFLGFTRAVQAYSSFINTSSVGAFEKYFPVLALAVQKKNNKGDDTLNRDQLASFFLRWVLPKAHAEFYIEYGYNDYGINIRDYLLGPTHSAAYIVGLKKIVLLRDKEQIEFGAELTQMSQSPDWMVRNAGNWYEHGQIFEGYTNQNQIMGAGAGFGANVFSIDATWVKGSKRLGFVIERVDRDPLDHPVKWVDLGLGIMPQWRHNQFLFSGLFQLINSQNYLWEKGNTPINVHSKLSIQYYF